MLLTTWLLACVGGPGGAPQPELGMPEPEPDWMPPAADTEVRAVWVTRWSFGSAEEIDAILDGCAAAGFTHVLLQVRGRFDAFYPSELEPWASELGGKLGRDPGWDPLAHAVAGAHARNLELHAWLNVYALWQGNARPASEGGPHPYAAHPDWAIQDRAGRIRDPGHSYLFASPGNPEVRAHVVSVVRDLADRYDVDGIHLDYVRYPGRDFGFDPASLAAAGKVEDFDEWRRQQIRGTVAEMAAAVDVPLTGAVWGVYRDTWDWRVGGGYDNYFQDSHGMLADESLAAIAPMIYWPVARVPGSRLDFATLATDHVVRAGTHAVWTGIDASKLDWDEVVDCIAAARRAGARGVALFEFQAVRDKGWIDRLATGPFSPAEPGTALGTGTSAGP